MAKQDTEKIKALTGEAARAFGYAAAVRDTTRALRSLAVDMGAMQPDLSDGMTLPQLPAAMRRAYEAVRDARDGAEAEVDTLDAQLGDALAGHESANARLAALLDSPRSLSITASPAGDMERYTTAAGGTLMLLPVHPDGANPGYNDDAYIDIVLHTDEHLWLDSIQLTAANMGWGDGRLDVWMPDDCEDWFGEQIVPERTDRDAPLRHRIDIDLNDTLNGGPVELAPGDHTLRIHYYSRNEQTPLRTIGIGAAKFNLSRY